MERGCTRVFILAHGAPDIERIAIASIGIADERNRNRLGESADIGEHLGHREQAKIGKSARGGRTEAGHINGFKAGAFGEASLETIEDERRDQHRGPVEQLTQAAGSFAQRSVRPYFSACIWASYSRSLESF